MAVHGCKLQFSQQTAAPGIALLHKHKRKEKTGQEKNLNKFEFPIYTDPLAHQHLNENMNLQSKRIYGWESSWSVRGKMTTIAWDKYGSSSGGRRRKLAKNKTLHKIISSFQTISPHLSCYTFLQLQCISLPVYSTLKQTRPGCKGLIFLLVKYLARSLWTSPFVPCFCSPGGAVGELYTLLSILIIRKFYSDIQRM